MKVVNIVAVLTMNIRKVPMRKIHRTATGEDLSEEVEEDSVDVEVSGEDSIVMVHHTMEMETNGDDRELMATTIHVVAQDPVNPESTDLVLVRRGDAVQLIPIRIRPLVGMVCYRMPELYQKLHVNLQPSGKVH